jgi:hypothetical protein
MPKSIIEVSRILEHPLFKLLFLLALTGFLSWVTLGIQPRIDGLLEQVQGEAIPQDIAAKIAPLRGLRKRLAATLRWGQALRDER